MATDLNWHFHPARRAAHARRHARRQRARRAIGLLAAASVGFVAWATLHFL